LLLSRLLLLEFPLLQLTFLALSELLAFGEADQKFEALPVKFGKKRHPVGSLLFIVLPFIPVRNLGPTGAQ